MKKTKQCLVQKLTPGAACSFAFAGDYGGHFNKLQEIKWRYHYLLRKPHWGRKDMCNREVKTKCIRCGS